MLAPAQDRSEAGRIHLHSRETVVAGERVRVEIGLGALVDEVELGARVVAIEPTLDGAPPCVVLAIDPDCAGSLTYLVGVLSGQHPARARAYRRISVDVPVRWRYGEIQQETRARDLSRGGAFVLSRLAPPVGTPVLLEFDVAGRAGPLRLEAMVSWVQRQGTQCGFGTRFIVRSREDAERVAALLRSLDDDGAQSR